jgi:hypothetical protein
MERFSELWPEGPVRGLVPGAYAVGPYG